MAIATINPATGEHVKTFQALNDAQIDAKIARAADTFRSFRRLPFSERAAMMARAGQILDDEKEAFARLMTLEMGKPLKAAADEAAKCAWVCRYYAENAERFLAPKQVQTDAAHSSVRYQPIGPVLAVMPWNFPFWQVFRFVAPGLMAGNVGLLKHASNVPQCALAIEDVLRRAGFPEGAFQTLLIGSDQVARVLHDERVAAATLTGSEEAGRRVAELAGKLIKKTVLELGGSDPFIVMPSANLDSAIQTAVKARTINNGQSCIAAKRFIVAESIADRFEHGFAEAMGRLRVGDPFDTATEIGPLATEQIVADLDEQVRSLVSAGARVLLGGTRLEQPGYFYAPTALAGVPPDAPAAGEEIFGPVAMIFRVPDMDAAIKLANATSFGLGASAWTNDAAEQQRFVDELEAGMVFVNAMVASDPRLPFGGVKRSGYGRELGEHGIYEFVNIKTVQIASNSAAPPAGRSSTE